MNQEIIRKKKTICFLLSFIFFATIPIHILGTTNPDTTFSIEQNNKTISGKVTDETGEPLPGVSVVEKGTTNGTMTDADGNFSLNVKNQSTIIFSYIGYKSQEVAASSINGNSIILIEDALNLDEVIVTGYTTQKKADLTGSVSVVKVDQLRASTSGNAMRAAQGKVAGMSVSGNGSPSSDAKIRIRGEGSVKSSNDPLYIIDGTPTTRSMNELATLDIESMQVLKDASSASIYGSRAANGVIIITTRKGKKGTTVDFSASNTFVSKKKPYDLMNTEQRGIAQYWAIKNDNPNADPNKVGLGWVDGYGGIYQYQDHKDANGNYVLDKVSWREFLDPEPGRQTMRTADTDWQKEVLRTGYIQQYNVTLSTGSDSGNALFALDYYNNKGTVKGSYFNRINARMNSDYSWLNGKVKVGENFTVSKWRRNINNFTTGSDDEIFNRAKGLMSAVPVHTVDGGWGGPTGGMSDRQNPVRLIEDNKDNYEDNLRLFGNAYASVEILKGLTFRSSFGLDLTGTWRRLMELKFQSGSVSSERNKLTQKSGYDFNWNNSNILQYVFDIEKHNFDVMLGQETIQRNYAEMGASRMDYGFETPDYMILNSGEREPNNDGYNSNHTMISWFAKMNYNYDDRYLASFTLRRDASSVFGDNNPWATFPAFSLGWVLSNEKFFGDLSGIFSQLKLRYGWGRNGNASIDDYASAELYQALYDQGVLDGWNWGTAYDIVGNEKQLMSGYRRRQPKSPDLKWETTAQHNFGLDFGVLNSKLGGSFDYYRKTTSDLIMQPGSVATVGEGGNLWHNSGEFTNNGFELTLYYRDNIGNVGFDISGVFAHNKQTVKYVPDYAINDFAGNNRDQTIIGRPRYSLFGYVAEGLFQSQEEIDAAPKQTGATPGHIRFKDLNGDNVIDDKDRTWIGNENPDLEYGITLGLTWKNFDFNIFFNGVIGKDLNVRGWKGWSDLYSLGTTGENYGTRMLDAWTPTNTGSTIPAMSLTDKNDDGRFSTYFVESGSYMKIRNAEIGYTLPQNILNRILIKRARVSLRAENIATFHKSWGDNKYTGLDPETPGSGYPLPFSMTMGVNITF